MRCACERNVAAVPGWYAKTYPAQAARTERDGARVYRGNKMELSRMNGISSAHCVSTSSPAMPFNDEATGRFDAAADRLTNLRPRLSLRRDPGSACEFGVLLDVGGEDQSQLLRGRRSGLQTRF